MNFLGRIQYAGSQIGTVDAHPVGFGCQAVINSGGLFEMGYVGFLNIMSMRSVGARGFQADQAKRLWRGKAMRMMDGPRASSACPSRSSCVRLPEPSIPSSAINFPRGVMSWLSV